MGLLSDIVNAVVTATATIINVVVRTSVEIIDAATDAWNDYQRNRALNRLPPAEQIKEKARDELKEVNNEILSLLDKYNDRGRLSETDRKRAESLNHQRAELMQTISGAAESAVAGEISQEPDAFEKLLLSNERAHILQGQVGVSVFGKKCPMCNRDMLIQWPRSVTTVELSDFFWGCSGWYQTLPNGLKACNKTVRMSESDFNIFARTDSEEMQIRNAELTEITLLPGPSEIIIERLDDVISDQRSQRRGAEDYRCPTHGEELVLRKKHQPTSLLDQYFLGCPRWKPNNQGCGYMVKLKSAMQLSTLLKKESGEGIL